MFTSAQMPDHLYTPPLFVIHQSSELGTPTLTQLVLTAIYSGLSRCQ
jgi:hypothetical protein